MFAAALAAAALLVLAQASPAAQLAPSAAGDWSGELQVSGTRLPLRVHVRSGLTAGALTGTLDSPAQNAAGLPIEVREAAGVLRFTLSSAGASYEGRWDAGAAKWTGVFTQNGASLPLELSRAPVVAGVAAAPSRPQTPKPPFPYREVEVAYDNAAGPAHLAGTLTVPAGSGPFPAVLLITGSGLQDRDETIFGHHPFAVWADTLARRGIAVLRVDDRGMGGSTGDARKATTADFATDVAAGLAFLKGRPEVDPHRVGLLGHSEGGIIAPIVAARDPSIAFIVLLAGSGEDGETLMLHQKRLIEAAAGLPPGAVEQANATMRRLDDAVKDAPDQTAAETRLQAAWRATLTSQGQPTDAPLPMAVRALAQPWMRWFLSYDPRSTLARVRCPILAVGGSKDLQVPAPENLKGIKAATRANPDVTTVELPGLNHLLQTADTGQVAEYGRIEETVSPAALKLVSDWIVAHTDARTTE